MPSTHSRRPRLVALEDRLAPANMLLPDFQVLSANLRDWTFNTRSNGNREIRFSTALANLGAGPFEINGTTQFTQNADGTLSQVVNQKIFLDDGSTTTRVAGAFSYHPTHGHIHFDDMAWGRLRTRPTANWQDGAIVAIGPKTSFCLIDIQHTNPGLPGSPSNAVYTKCGTQTQGISVGWNDVYNSGLDGQAIDISGLPNGNYWLEVTADPFNRILETDEANNTTRIPITIGSQPPIGFRILSASPTGAQTGVVDHIDLAFNQAADAATFIPTDVVITGPSGPIGVTSVTYTDAAHYRINFAPQTSVGTYTYSIGPDIRNLSGQQLDQNNDGIAGHAVSDVFINVFTIAAPTVVSVSPNGAVSTPISSVRITYDRPMVSSTFSIADVVQLTGPSGSFRSSIVGIMPVTPTESSRAFDVYFVPQSNAGGYAIVIGPHVQDALSNSIDLNGDGVTNSSDNFTGTFAITSGPTVGPDAFGYRAAAAPPPAASIIGRAGAFVIHTNADDATASVDLGTNKFNYYGSLFTGAGKVWVSSNGTVTFGDAGYTPFANDDMTNAAIPMLAPLWDDWMPGSSPFQVIGLFDDLTGDQIPERLIVEWNQVYHHLPGGNPSGVSFQVVLQLNTGARPGKVFFNYLDLDANTPAFNNGAGATVGWRAAPIMLSRTVVAENSFSNPLVQSGKAIEISVPHVRSITRMNDNPNSEQECEFRVVFNTPVTGVDVGDFVVSSTGSITGAKIDHVHATADASVYEVHVNSYSGNGGLRLDLIDNDSIVSVLGARLGGLFLGNGTYRKGESYTIVDPLPRPDATSTGNGNQPGKAAISFVGVFGAGSQIFEFSNDGPVGSSGDSKHQQQSASSKTCSCGH